MCFCDLERSLFPLRRVADLTPLYYCCTGISVATGLGVLRDIVFIEQFLRNSDAYLPVGMFAFIEANNFQKWTWDNRLVPNRKRRTSMLYTVTLLI